MTDIDSVWARLKACAADYAARGEDLRRLRAEAIVIRFMQEARIAPWPPPQVVEFFANELLSMVGRARANEAAEVTEETASA